MKLAGIRGGNWKMRSGGGYRPNECWAIRRMWVRLRGCDDGEVQQHADRLGVEGRFCARGGWPGLGVR